EGGVAVVGLGERGAEPDGDAFFDGGVAGGVELDEIETLAGRVGTGDDGRAETLGFGGDDAGVFVEGEVEVALVEARAVEGRDVKCIGAETTEEVSEDVGARGL